MFYLLTVQNLYLNQGTRHLIGFDVLTELLDNFETLYEETSLNFKSKTDALNIIWEIFDYLLYSENDRIFTCQQELSIMSRISCLLQEDISQELRLNLLTLLQTMLKKWDVQHIYHSLQISEEIDDILNEWENQDIIDACTTIQETIKIEID